VRNVLQRKLRSCKLSGLLVVGPFNSNLLSNHSPRCGAADDFLPALFKEFCITYLLRS
jgi:hypothetical protein